MKVLIFFFFVDKLNGNLPTITKTDKVKFIILVKPLKYTVDEYLSSSLICAIVVTYQGELILLTRLFLR